MGDSFNGVIVFNGSILLIFGFYVYFNRSRYRIKANRFLGLFLIVMAWIPICIGLAGLKMNPIFYIHGPLLVFVANPIFYFYYRSYLSNQNRFNKVDVLHFIPLAIQFGLWYYFVVKPFDFSNTSSYLLNLNATEDFYRLQRKIAGFAMSSIYVLLYIRMAGKFHATAKEQYSYTNSDILKWFYFLMIAIYIVPFLSGFLAFFKINKSGLYLTIVALISNFIMIVIIMLRPEIYKGVGAFVRMELTTGLHSLPEKKMIQLHKQLLDVMNEKKLFLIQDLSLQDLSAELNSNLNYMSQTINAISKQSFFDFINTYRINHAKALLVDVSFSHYSVEGIGKESGFRSKSAFYNAFKKYCNMSPAVYRNKFLP